LVAENERFALQDLGKMNANDTAALKQKADIVDKATDSLERAINEIAQDRPTDAKGQELVPQWISDYRIYIQNRRQFSDKLRSASTRPYFSETEVEGVPISERIGKFARENDMRTCQPPLDLSV
jgi:Zn-dependent oligopeptidase